MSEGLPKGRRWWAGQLAGWLLAAVVLAYATWFFGFATAHDGPTERLPVRALISSAPMAAWPSLIDALRERPAEPVHRTGLDQPTIWLMVTIAAAGTDRDRILHLTEKSVGLGEAILLDAALQPIAKARFGVTIEARGARRALPGYAIELPVGSGDEDGALTLLARLEPNGVMPGLGANLWDTSGFVAAQNGEQQRATMLIGALMLLAVYAIAAAQAARAAYLLVFAFWLVARCGFVMSAVGFNYFAFGTAAGSVLGIGLRQAALLTFPFACVLLIWSLMQENLRGTRSRALLKGVTILAGVAAVLAGFVPTPVFQVALWLIGSLVLFTLVPILYNSLKASRSGATRWYLFGLLLDAAAAGNELLHATGLYSSPFPWFNLQQVSLLSAMLTGMAVGTSVALERSRRIKTQAAAISALARYEAVYRTVPIGLISFGADDRVERFNDGFARLFGLPLPVAQELESDAGRAAQLADDALQASLDRVMPLALRSRIRTELEDRGECDFAYRIGGENDTRWLRVLARGSREAFEASLSDITEHKNMERRLTRAAEHDALTGALNRRGLARRIDRMIDRAANVSRLSLGYIDLDRFKLLNDLYGHTSGDAVLQEVVRRLQSTLGPNVAIARLGGDEFALLFGEDETSHDSLARKSLDAIAGTPFHLPPKSFAVTASVGLFRFAAGLSQEELIAGADRACRDAKRKGRNQVVVENDASVLIKRKSAELAVLARLQDSRAFDEFELAVQPILALDESGRLAGEVLLRHRSADGSLNSPGGLIEAAEQRGEMSTIDRWVLQQSLAWLDRNAQRFGRLDFLSLNLSANSLNDEFFKTYVLAALKKHHAIAPMLVFEIDESVVMQDVFVMEKFVAALRETGARIALDDFGSGQSNFASLTDIGASYLKIDGQFVRALSGHGSSTAIIRTITVLAHELGMQCIAAWVEDPETLKVLKAMGADYGQGHALAAPMPLGAFETLCAGGEIRHTPEIRRALGLSSAATAADVQRQLARLAPLV